MKKSLSCVTGGILACFVLILSFGALTVNADTNSGWSTKSVNGKSYQYRSSTWNYSGLIKTLSAGTVIWSNSGNVDAGWMGAQARLYKADGTLEKCTSYVYNSSATTILSTETSKVSTKNTYYYSQAYVKFYNGNGYNSYAANRSPNNKVQNLDDFSSIKEVAIGDDTYTCGSGLYADGQNECPDLIEAIGINGNRGYVFSSELFPESLSPEEALESFSQESATFYVPVYDLLGNIIDQFCVD